MELSGIAIIGIGIGVELPLSELELEWNCLYRNWNWNLIAKTELTPALLATNHGCAHDSQLSTCTADGKLIVALGVPYVHST